VVVKESSVLRRSWLSSKRTSVIRKTEKKPRRRESREDKSIRLSRRDVPQSQSKLDAAVSSLARSSSKCVKKRWSSWACREPPKPRRRLRMIQ